MIKKHTRKCALDDATPAAAKIQTAHHHEEVLTDRITNLVLFASSVCTEYIKQSDVVAFRCHKLLSNRQCFFSLKTPEIDHNMTITLSETIQ